MSMVDQLTSLGLGYPTFSGAMSLKQKLTAKPLQIFFSNSYNNEQSSFF
jgi:hypothetical protein